MTWSVNYRSWTVQNINKQHLYIPRRYIWDFKPMHAEKYCYLIVWHNTLQQDPQRRFKSHFLSQLSSAATLSTSHTRATNCRHHLLWFFSSQKVMRFIMKPAISFISLNRWSIISFWNLLISLITSLWNESLQAARQSSECGVTHVNKLPKPRAKKNYIPNTFHVWHNVIVD